MRRILVYPSAIKTQRPCAARWGVYRKQFEGNKAHPLADLLTRPNVPEKDIYDDFGWVLSTFRFPRYNRTASSKIARELMERLKASWIASPLLPVRSYLPKNWMDATSCLFHEDLPTDWKERALAVIAEMERCR